MLGDLFAWNRWSIWRFSGNGSVWKASALSGAQAFHKFKPQNSICLNVDKRYLPLANKSDKIHNFHLREQRFVRTHVVFASGFNNFRVFKLKNFSKARSHTRLANLSSSTHSIRNVHNYRMISWFDVVTEICQISLLFRNVCPSSDKVSTSCWIYQFWILFSK